MGRASSESDDLVTAAKRGDQLALQHIWTQFSPAVLGYVRGRGASSPEDLTSDIFVAVFERLHRFRGNDADFRAFVFTVAHHRLVDELRRKANRPQATSYDPLADTRLAPSAEDVALANIADEQIATLLRELSPNQRDVVLLRVIGDLTLEQTAQVLGKRTSAVKALQHRAFAALRKILTQAVSL